MSGPLLILTNERDFAADDVIRRLADRPIDIVRVNAEQAAASPVPTWGPKVGSSVKPAVVWWRQFRVDPDVSDLMTVDNFLVSQQQWRAWIDGFDDGAVWVNGLWDARRAESKVTQLRTADRVGFDLPRTTVTNSPQHAREFVGAVGPCVVKSLAGAYFEFSDRSFVFTEAVSDDVLAEDSAWLEQPVIVQESLVGGADVRVVAIGERLFGASSAGDSSDWRKESRDVDAWSSWPIPRVVAEACRAYMTELGLHYAAFDFIDTGASVCFLEANQAGEWMFLDRALDLGISDCLADYLERLVRGRTHVP